MNVRVLVQTMRYSIPPIFNLQKSIYHFPYCKEWLLELLEKYIDITVTM